MKDRDSKTQNTGSNTVDPTDLEAVKVAYRNILGEDVDGEMDWDLFAAIQSQLHTLQYEYEIYEQSYYARYPFGEVFREAVEQLTEWTDNTSGPPELFQELLTCPEPVRKLFSDCRAMKKFVADQLVDYARIQEFHEGYMENLSDAHFFSKSDWEKIIQIESYLYQRDPRNGMEAALTAMEELRPVIAKGLHDMRTDVCRLYNEAFDRLEREAALKNVTCDMYANRRHTIASINACHSIRELEEFRRNLPIFKSQELVRILTATPDATEPATEAVSYAVTGVLLRIRNEDELNEYLEKLRKEMLSILETNRVIDLK
jgi:hypothetical protein